MGPSEAAIVLHCAYSCKSSSIANKKTHNTWRYLKRHREQTLRLVTPDRHSKALALLISGRALTVKCYCTKVLTGPDVLSQ